MKKFFEIIRNIFQGGNDKNYEPPVFEIETQIALIRNIEKQQIPEPGRRIHSFEYLEFVLSLDVEITGLYRLIAFEGKEKRYSFSIKGKPGNYDLLQEGLKQATTFLSSERKLKDIPNNEFIRGFYFGL